MSAQPSKFPEWVGGRKRYNRERQLAAASRRHVVAGLRGAYSQTEIAHLLGVHKSTICRDLAGMSIFALDPRGKRCPVCRRFYIMAALDGLGCTVRGWAHGG